MLEASRSGEEKRVEIDLKKIFSELLHLRLPPQTLLSILLLGTLILSNDAKASESDISVIGGRPVEACEFPHLASVHTYNPVEQHVIICSGSVVDDNYDGKIQSVLTAAHCIESAEEQTNPGLISVRLGHDNRSQDPLLPVSAVTVHPEEDLAILKLQRPIDTDLEECVAAPPIATAVHPSKPAILVGFGTTSEDSTQSARIAHVAQATILSGSNFCTDGFPTMICIGDDHLPPSDDNPRLGPGDSGSGLLQENDMSTAELIGVGHAQFVLWAVSLAENITIPDIRKWVIDQINQNDTGIEDLIPPTTITNIELNVGQFFVGHSNTIRIKIFSRQTDRGNDVVVDDIATKLDLSTPCLTVLSITDRQGNTIPFVQDEEGIKVELVAEGNRYDDTWIISVLPDASQYCVPNIHGVGHAQIQGTMEISHAWNQAGVSQTKHYEYPVDHNIHVHRPIIIPPDLSSEKDSLLHEAALLNQHIFARRMGNDIRIWGKSDIFKSFYIEYEGQFIKIIGFNDPAIHLHFEYGFDTVIPNFFVNSEYTYLPLLRQ